MLLDMESTFLHALDVVVCDWAENAYSQRLQYAGCKLQLKRIRVNSRYVIQRQ